jgi:hypothetical protein
VFEPEEGLPSPLALIACDHGHVDPVGKSKSLLGVFVHRRMEAFAEGTYRQLAEGHPRQRVRAATCASCTPPILP